MTAQALVVDDASTIRLYHASLLESLGYAVEHAENGMEALEHIAQRFYDLVLVDINMPIMDGISFLERLRRGEHQRSVPVVIVSTECGEHEPARGLAAGANFFVTKPLSRDRLASICRLLSGGQR